ncbi:MAG: hypothetical protein PHV03_09325 [Desulfitobacteriaceae bacterium]|nr:hypothetical protein [Desulfitobacteriaceae bacterium]
MYHKEDTVYRDLMGARDMTVDDSTLLAELNAIANHEFELEALNKGSANGAFRLFIGTIIAGFSVHLQNTANNDSMRVFYSELMSRMLNTLLKSEYGTREYKIFMIKLKNNDREDYLKHLIKSCLDVCIKTIIQGFDKVLLNNQSKK